MSGRPYIKIIDTTLRDGEQTCGVSFNSLEKLNIAKGLLSELRVDVIEVASARVSQGEADGASAILEWARTRNMEDRVEILGFVDQGKSIRWIKDLGGGTINLLSKGSVKHVRGQLGKDPGRHIQDVAESIREARGNDLRVNLYLEDWSSGMINDPDYVFSIVEAVKDLGVGRLMLPDTLGIMTPEQSYEFVHELVKRYPDASFDFHAHNDYDLAIANVMAAVRAGATGVHTTINGLGERAGNAILSSVVTALKDMVNVRLGVVEKKIYRTSRLVEAFSNMRIPSNRPLIGDNVFTQTCGVHADGDRKGNLYHGRLLPERFGRNRVYALGKTSGKANILKNLQELGIELDEDTLAKVTKRVIELGDKKERVSIEDLPFIIADVMEEPYEQQVEVVNFSLGQAKGLRAVATVKVSIAGKMYEASDTGHGQYDAFFNAIKSIFRGQGQSVPQLLDYQVVIPPGGMTDALVEAIITWQDSRPYKTSGVDTDQTCAAVKATERMLNIIYQDGNSLMKGVRKLMIPLQEWSLKPIG